MRTHGSDYFAGRQQRDGMSRFSVHFFRLGVSKQNGVSFHRLRDVLKRHPCRLGLKWASMPPRTEMGIHAHFPLGANILLRNSRRKRSTENPEHAIPLLPPRKIITPVLGRVKLKK